MKLDGINQHNERSGDLVSEIHFEVKTHLDIPMEDIFDMRMYANLCYLCYRSCPGYNAIEPHSKLPLYSSNQSSVLLLESSAAFASTPVSTVSTGSVSVSTSFTSLVSAGSLTGSL